MKKAILCILAVWAISNYTNAQAYEYTIASDYVEYAEGKMIIGAHNKDFTIGVLCKDTDIYDKHFSFDLIITNNGERVTFDPSTIIITTYDKRGRVQECDVLSSDEWWTIVRRNLIWFGGGNYKEVTTEVNQSFSNGQEKTNATTIAKTKVYTGELDKNLKEARSEIKENYLTKTTIKTNNTIRGQLVCRNTKAQNIVITIPIKNTKFIFDLNKY